MNRKRSVLLFLCFAFSGTLTATPKTARKTEPKRRVTHKKTRRALKPKPDNAIGKIVFSSAGHFYMINADGTRREKLPKDRLLVGPGYFNASYKSRYTLAPDGIHAIYSQTFSPPNRDSYISAKALMDATTEVFGLVNLRTGKKIPLDSRFPTDYAFSPDGKRLMFYVYGRCNPEVDVLYPDYCGGIMLYNLNGSKSPVIEVNAPKPTGFAGDYDYNVFFTSDGSVVFCHGVNVHGESGQNEAPQDEAYYIWKEQAGTQRISEEEYYKTKHHSSPDGTHYLWAYDREEPKIHIRSVPPALDENRRVKEIVIKGSHPNFMPNGKQIVYHLDGVKGAGGIYICNIDGSGKRQLTRNASDDYPQWRLIKKLTK